MHLQRVPYVVDNGDINAPYPGHKLTVGYSLGEVNDAGDASVIRWYIVADDGTETLSCSSTANADKSFTIPSEAEGKHIKVVVIPQTISGTTGEAAEYKVEAFVREGYEDPSSTGSDIELGKGVNIFPCRRFYGKGLFCKRNVYVRQGTGRRFMGRIFAEFL